MSFIPISIMSIRNLRKLQKSQPEMMKMKRNLPFFALVIFQFDFTLSWANYQKLSKVKGPLTKELEKLTIYLANQKTELHNVILRVLMPKLHLYISASSDILRFQGIQKSKGNKFQQKSSLEKENHLSWRHPAKLNDYCPIEMSDLFSEERTQSRLDSFWAYNRVEI